MTQNLAIYHQEVQNVQRRKQLCFVLRNARYFADNGTTSLEVYSVRQNCKLVSEVPRELVFQAAEVVETVEEGEEQIPLSDKVLTFISAVYDIAILVQNGMAIDVPEEVLPCPPTINDMYEG